MLTVDWEKNSVLYHWPESQKLKTALETKKTGICYTMPGLKSDDKLTTAAYDDVNKLFTEHFGKIAPEVNSDGLRKLLKMGHLEAAFNATTVLLSQMGQGLNKIGRNSVNNETSLQLWSLRFQLMFTLKMHQQAVEEMTAFEDLEAPDLYYQYYPTSNRNGTMIPFSLRLMHAEILRFTPFPWNAVQRIEKLRTSVEWILRDISDKPKADQDAWKSRLVSVEKVKSRILFALGEYSHSMETMEQSKTIANPSEKEKICFDMMRMALTSGDDFAANAQLLEGATQVGVSQNEILVHKALRAIFLGAYPHANEYIQRLMKMEEQHPNTANLAAIGNLYVGKAVDGVQVLSKCKKPLPEILMTNIRAMSELGLPAAQKDTLLFEITNNV